MVSESEWSWQARPVAEKTSIPLSFRLFLFVTPVLNPLLRRLLESRWHRLASDHFLLLSFTGRKSGMRYTIPAGYVRDGSSLILTTDRPWSRNLRGDVTATMLLEGEARSGRVEIISDPAVMTPLMQLAFAKDRIGARFMQIGIDQEGRPDPDDVERAAQRGAVVIRINLDQPALSAS